MACLGPDEADLRAQIAAAHRAGNVALLGRSATAERIARAARGRVEIIADPLSPPPDAVLVAAEGPVALSARTRLAESEGPIVPVVVADDRGAYDASRLVMERTLTINTTASGGNASLLSLAEGPA